MALGGAQKSENVLMNKGCSMGLILPETELLDLEGMKTIKKLLLLAVLRGWLLQIKIFQWTFRLVLSDFCKPSIIQNRVIPSQDNRVPHLETLEPHEPCFGDGGVARAPSVSQRVIARVCGYIIHMRHIPSLLLL